MPTFPISLVVRWICYGIGRLFIYALSFGFVECEKLDSHVDIGFFGSKKPGSNIYVLPEWATTVVGLMIFVVAIILYSWD